MEDSMAQGDDSPVPLPVQLWKVWAGWACAGALALLFLVSGLWKLLDPLATEQRMVQMLFPAQIAMAVALLTGITEAWAGLLILVPRWRRWGAWLCGLLLVAFMVYMGVNYARLTGEDCSCFPWLKRVVGPGFFIGDGLMLLAAFLAGLWAGKPESYKQALMSLGALVVFAGVLYGVTAARQTGIQAPPSITVDGTSLSLRQGRVLVYFFDPECMHCFAGAQGLQKLAWREVKVVAVPTVNPQWGANFLRDTGLRAGLSTDTAALREKFKFTDPPYAVALDRGRQVEAFPFFDDKEPAATLKKLGWVK
ncbi:MAG: DoxX family membrane protein [Acidobacteria bacterium]|nr:DoxX family membrane protein [Acidobacteriota bacterium]